MVNRDDRADADIGRAGAVRPEWPEYYMRIAMTVRSRANCIGNKVGAVLVRDGRIIATGYNGTPQGLPNCDVGGCERCANREQYRTSTGYDVCICVHAEQNALLSAARFGTATEGATMYTTMRPCFGCAKELLQARVHGVVYLHEWRHADDVLWQQYLRLQAAFAGGVVHLPVDDPDADWAVSSLRAAAAVLVPLPPAHG
jgi:dCMP deaminase